MMMTAQLSSPKLAAQMTALSVKRPSISTLKRKLSAADDETASPTSLDELTSSNSSNSSNNSSADEASVISPKKKLKAEGSATISTAMTKWEETQDVKAENQPPQQSTPTSASAPATPSAAYVPFAFTSAPASALDEDELNILNYFLA